MSPTSSWLGRLQVWGTCASCRWCTYTHLKFVMSENNYLWGLGPRIVFKYKRFSMTLRCFLPFWLHVGLRETEVWLFVMSWWDRWKAVRSQSACRMKSFLLLLWFTLRWWQGEVGPYLGQAGHMIAPKGSKGRTCHNKHDALYVKQSVFVFYVASKLFSFSFSFSTHFCA